jgi:hypothetical protein
MAIEMFEMGNYPVAVGRPHPNLPVADGTALYAAWMQL